MSREEANKLIKQACERTWNEKTCKEIFKALSQEPCKDIEEIAEVIKCDADAETKCKMISNILTAKPHYFKVSQEPTSEMVHVETLRQVMWERDIAIEQLHELGYEWGQKIEPCDDAISRDAVDKYIARLLSGYLYDGERERLEIFSAYLWELPSVTQKCEKCAMNGSGSKYCDNCGQKSGKWITKHHVYGVTYCSECDFELKIDDTNYCPNCGAKMESEDK